MSIESIDVCDRDAKHPAIAAHPEMTGLIFENPVRKIVEKTVAGSIDAPSPAREAHETAPGRAEPERSARVLFDVIDRHFGQALRQADALEAPVAEPRDSAAAGSHPQGALAIFMEADHVGAAEALLRPIVLESFVVKAAQALDCS